MASSFVVDPPPGTGGKCVSLLASCYSARFVVGLSFLGLPAPTFLVGGGALLGVSVGWGLHFQRRSNYFLTADKILPYFHALPKKRLQSCRDQGLESPPVGVVGDFIVFSRQRDAEKDL